MYWGYCCAKACCVLHQSRCISFSLKLWSQAGVASISTHWIPKGETRDAWNQCLDFLQPSLEKYENMIDIFATKSRWRFEAISRPFKNCMNYKLWIGNRLLSLLYHTVPKPPFFVQKFNFRGKLVNLDFLHKNSIICTVFENHRTSLMQHCERSELSLHFE